MIPQDRAVVGRDVEEVSKKLELSVMDACWVFGLNMPAWSSVVKGDQGDEPVSDVCLALLVRYLDMFPDSCPIDKRLPPNVFHERMQEYNDMADESERLPNALIESYGFIGALLGRDQSAGYRWLRQRGGTRPVIDRYINVINRDLSQNIVSLKELQQLALIEHKARGLTEEAQSLLME